MSARLMLASRWMPRFLMTKEVENVRRSTNATLDALLAAHSLEVPTDPVPSGGLEARRAAMAHGHEQRVQALIAGLGRERAIVVGREALFATGLALGQDAQKRLKVGDGRADLLNAAKVLYRVLGIEFTVTDDCLEVHRCALAEHYSADACRILSAVDEGVVSGLYPRAAMRFEKHLTDGCPRCVARIRLEER